MNHRLLTTTLCALAGTMLAGAQVPGLINYQGRLTDANGAPVTGSKNFSLSIYDAATGGNLLYTETIGPVTLDANGVYSFQFGSAGTSNSQVTETLATTDALTLVYTKALANAGIVENSISVTDGTNSWTQSAGNPGVGAAATANTIAGFVIGATITNGGSGYPSPPTVTITGLGSGAAATATISSGVVTGITITNAGSGYTGGASISISPPVIPFRVEYSGGSLTATYSSAPAAGAAITATYRYGTDGIAGALGSAAAWMAVSVEDVTQGVRQQVLAVPYSISARQAEEATGALAAEMAALRRDLAYALGGWQPVSFFKESFGAPTRLISNETTVTSYPSSVSAVSESSNFYNSWAPSGTTLTYIPANPFVRSISFYASISGGTGGTFSFSFNYTDGTTSKIENSDVFGPHRSDAYRHISNPNPSKQVASISIQNPTSGSYYNSCKTIYNTTATATLDLTNYDFSSPPKKIGCFLELLNETSDTFSISLVCTAGTINLNHDSYTDVSVDIGQPLKLILTHSPDKTKNTETFTKIKTIAIRYEPQ
jgi:hypothetical protein